MHIKNAQILKYDTGKYDFRGWVSQVLRWDQLERLHQRPDMKDYHYTELVPQIEVCRNALEKAYPLCEPLYARFVHDVIGAHFGGIKAYQKPPSFRIHYSGRGSSSFHRDRDYGVPDGRLNAWVPLTPVWGTNSIWIESEEGKEDFLPVELNHGEILIFDGANLLHGSRWNSTDTTRVSFDLRFARQID